MIGAIKHKDRSLQEAPLLEPYAVILTKLFTLKYR